MEFSSTNDGLDGSKKQLNFVRRREQLRSYGEKPNAYARYEDVSTRAESYVRQLHEANSPYSEREVKDLLYALLPKVLETLEKERFLKMLTGSSEENKDESWISDEESEIQNMQAKLMDLERSNEDTIQEIETLISKVGSDMNTLDSNLSLATEILEKYDLEIEKLTESEKETKDEEAPGKGSVTPEDLQETIRLLVSNCDS